MSDSADYGGFDMGHLILEGFMSCLNIYSVLLMFLGVLVGIVFGAIPGLSGTLGIILFLPLTRSIDLMNSLIFLSCIFIGGEFGGSISAILIGTPGTNSAVCTMMEGYPLAKKGHARKALMMALGASTVGGLLSACSLLFLAPTLAKYTLEFGAPEFFAIAVFGLSIIASVSGKSIEKGIFAGAVGIILSLVGLDTVSGMPRFTFKNLTLYRGLELVALLTGLFALASIIEKVGESFKKDSMYQEEMKLHKTDKLSLGEFLRCKWNLLLGSIIGIVIGIVPGIGTGVASFLAYDTSKRFSKEPEKFGTGHLEGIAAVESSNNGVTAASLIPLLTLGLPGSPSAAVLVGAFTMNGLSVGPLLFKEHGILLYSLMTAIIIANIIMFIEGRTLSGLMAKITKVPNDVLVPLLMVVCAAGAVSVNNSGFDLMVFIIAGTTGYFLSLLKVPLVPIVIGFVLGNTMDSNLRKGLVMTGGNFLTFVTRPITFFILLITISFLVFSIIKEEIRKRKKYSKQ